MVFIHPEFLWGLLAVSIPIVIHLFDFRKNRKVYFSDIRFLKQVKHSSRKPLKLKQLLILVSRIAFIFFLVIVFAQPILPTDSKKQLVGGTKLIYIDNSQSMSALVDSKETALERAKATGQSIINQLPKGQEVIIANNDNLNRFLIPKSLNQASEQISSINLSDKPSVLNQLGIAIIDFQKRESNLSDIFIISDFQKSTFKLDVGRLDSTLSYWLSPIKIETINNCVVDSVYLKETAITSDGDIEIEVIIVNYGNQLIENLPIKVFVGNRQVSASSISIPPYQRENISFSLGKISSAESAYIQIEDYPITFDNIFNFSLSEKRNLTVFEIVGANSSNFIETVFGNRDLFSVFTNNYQSIDNDLFEESDFVVLNQIDDPKIELIQQLKLFAENGGSVLVVPGMYPNLESFLGITSKLVKRPIYQKRKLLSPSAKSPFFSTILEKSTRKVEMPNATSVWAWGNDRSALLSFEDGTPFLSEISSSIYFLSAPLIDSMSNFQLHALFVPVMYVLASQSLSPTTQLFSRVGDDYYDINNDSIDFKDLIKLSKDNIDIISGKTKVGNRWRLTFPKEITTTGNYKILIDDSVKGYLAINLDKEESQLAPTTNTELENLFSAHKINFLESYNSKSTILSSFDSGFALWKYALTICLLFLLLETLLIRFL